VGINQFLLLTDLGNLRLGRVVFPVSTGIKTRSGLRHRHLRIVFVEAGIVRLDSHPSQCGERGCSQARGPRR
jgi:hypothetical protein